MTPKEWVRYEFPGIPEENFYIADSKIDGRYNCIAWAANDKTRWWWPIPNWSNYPNAPQQYWPANAPRNLFRQAFIITFQEEGYEPCDFDVSVDPDYEKVVIYETAFGEVRHMARQLRSGRWTSKLGSAYVITHKNVTDIEGTKYGHAAQMLRRPIKKVPIKQKATRKRR